jgi:hypothetical protein
MISLQDQVASGWKQRVVVCVLSVTEWLASNVATRILIRTYKFRTTSKTLPPLRIFVSRKPWQLFVEASFRNRDIQDSKVPVLNLKTFSLLFPSYHVFQLNRRDLPTQPIWLPQLFSLLHHGTYTTQTITNFVAAQTPTKGHRLTALQTTYGSISTSFITALGWLQTVVSCVRASSGFHLMTGTNFQHNANDICNCFYSFSTATLVSVCRCELCSIIRHSVYKKDST